MPTTWGPTRAGRAWTGTPDWQLSLEGESLTLTVGDRSRTDNVLMSEALAVVRGLIWSTVKLERSGSAPLVLNGIPNDAADAMMKALAAARGRYRHHQHVQALLADFDSNLEPVVAWVDAAQQACRTQLKTKGWLTEEFKREWSCRKPAGKIKDYLDVAEVGQHLAKCPEKQQQVVRTWRRDFAEIATNLNQRHLAHELETCRDFFNRVENSPLTEEQARAVVCFDNRVLVIASAGSGKTSTMVAKAGYALHRGLVPAEKILLLAFNVDAARELQRRVQQRLAPLGLPAEKIVARTFHAFGLDIIGAATGEKPSLAPWLENGGDLRRLLTLIDDLKDRDEAFRSNWDMFRLVLGQDLPRFGKERESPDAWDQDPQAQVFRTLNGEVVKSQGEQLIANWLFYNGVEYVYEAPYRHRTADARHRQYRPDFYLPQIDAYLEHWALDASGRPPAEFEGYLESMTWKRQLHAEHGTTLLETRLADLWSGQAFRYLAQELTKRGVELDPNPDRPVPGRPPIENERLVRTFRAFLTHTKSNRLDLRRLRLRLTASQAGPFLFRYEVFLQLFEAIWHSWERELRKDGCIDFDDMLNLAADCLEAGRWSSPFELVMVDEFQDASQARARLVNQLVKAPGRCLFAVGDDWQSVNRFAGADLGVMTEFEHHFGPAVTLRLERTFRCPQSLCDISSQFVQKNPRQLRKRVVSATPSQQEPVRVMRVEDERRIVGAIRLYLEGIAAAVPATAGKKVTVFVLGRYRKDQQLVPQWQDLDDRLEVSFLTVHASKGLEADYVVLPRMTAHAMGFPSRVADDPVLQLAMPEGDSFEFAEERRLFYVALTRARRAALLVTVQHKESPFIAELVREHGLEVLDAQGTVQRTRMCPACGEGFLVQRQSRYGPFLGCSRFPNCRHTEDERRATAGRGPLARTHRT